MRVGQGWSGEVKPNVWAKVNIELDDSDIQRVLNEENLHNLAVTDVPTDLAYQLLDILAERYVMAKLIHSHGFDPEKGMGRMMELDVNRRKVLGQLVALHKARE